nr:translation initiation factor IF-2-like [Ovis aries]
MVPPVPETWALGLLPSSTPQPCLPAPWAAQPSAQGRTRSHLHFGASAYTWTVCVSIGGPFEVLVGPPQPRQPVGRVPRLGGGEAPACRASQPGAGLRRVPRPPVSPHPGLPSDGARVWPRPRPPLRSPRAPPGCIDPWSSPPPSAALRPRRRRPAEDALGEVAPGGGAGLLRRRALSLVRPLPPHRDAPLLHEAVSSVLFGAAGCTCPEGRGRLGLRSRDESGGAGVRTATEVAAGRRGRADGRGARRQGGAPALRAAEGAQPHLGGCVCVCVYVYVCVCVSHTHRRTAVPPPPSSRTSSRPHRAQGAVLRRFSPALGSPARQEAAAPEAPVCWRRAPVPQLCRPRYLWPRDDSVNLPCPHPALLFPGPACRRRTSRVRGLVGAEATRGSGQLGVGGAACGGPQRGVLTLPLEVQAPSPLSGHEHSGACLLSIAAGRCISFHLSFSCCVPRPYACVL